MCTLYSSIEIVKKSFLPLAIILGVVLGCSKPEPDNNVTACILEKISTFEKEIACEKSATVKEYQYQDQTLYVFDPGTCGMDLASEVVDKSCVSMGFLNGISGNTTINGDNFSKAIYMKTIWNN